MRIRRFPDATSFLDAAGAYLGAHEALHNLPIAIARHCVADPGRYPGPNLFATVEDAAGVAGIALRTPPHRLQVYVPSGAAVLALAADLRESGDEMPGVHGPVPAVGEFATTWTAGGPLEPRVATNLRAFELSSVTPPHFPPGAMRVATPADTGFVAAAYREFHAETHAAAGGLPPEEIGRRALADGRAFVWDDGGPVALAARTGSTPNGARVGAVWTPQPLRRRGYATALVAALSQHLLDGGRRFCFLFTDLANPTSNSIYPRIGYRPIADFRDVDFVRAAG
jgi:RimJ/RimL family protein N-acetyltransferase